MNEDRLTGSAKEFGGQLQEGFGRATGDVKTQLQGKAKQAEGTLQDLYGQAKDTAASAARAIGAGCGRGLRSRCAAHACCREELPIVVYRTGSKEAHAPADLADGRYEIGSRRRPSC